MDSQSADDGEGRPLAQATAPDALVAPIDVVPASGLGALGFAQL